MEQHEEDNGSKVKYTIKGQPAEVMAEIAKMNIRWAGYNLRTESISTANGITTAIITRWNTCD